MNMDFKLDPSALAQFESMLQESGEGPLQEKVVEKKKAVRHVQPPPPKKGFEGRTDVVYFQCIHVKPTGNRIFTFEATMGTKVEALKDMLAPRMGIPTGQVCLTLFDVELTGGTLSQCGVPDESTLFVSDYREQVDAALESLTQFDRPTASQPPKPAWGEPATPAGAVRLNVSPAAAVPPSTPPAASAANATPPELLDGMTPAQLRQRCKDIGLTPSSWDKQKLISQINTSAPPASTTLTQPIVQDPTITSTTTTTSSSAGVSALKSKLQEEAEKRKKEAEETRRQAEELEARMERARAVREQQRLEEERLDRERRQNEEMVKQRLEEERQQQILAEQQRQEKIRKEMERQEEVRRQEDAAREALRSKAEEERLAREQAEQERLHEIAEQQAREAERKRLAEEARLREEAQRERERLDRERMEKEQRDREEMLKREQEELEHQRNERERLEHERLAKEKAERERLALEEKQRMEERRRREEQEAEERRKREQELARLKKQEEQQLERQRVAEQKAKEEVEAAEQKAAAFPPRAEAWQAQSSSSGGGSLASKMASMWDAKVDAANKSMKANPFSGNFDKAAATAGQASLTAGEYGTPEKGTKTYERMLKAQQWAVGKIDQLYVEFPKIASCTKQTDGSYQVIFKDVFLHYEPIDSVIVGTLRSAQKKGLVHYDNKRAFPLLQQGPDDNVIITLKPRE